MTRAKIPIKESIATKMLLVVLAFYLLIALLVSSGHVWMNYKYQKENIIQDLQDIGNAFANALAVNLWGLNEEALHATVEGMLLIPTLVGVSINTDRGDTVAIAGIVKENGESGNVGLHVSLAGLNSSEKKIHSNEKYNYEVFSRQFSIEYEVKDERILLGQATIYSNSSVIYRRMKLQGFMLAFDVALTLLTFTIALLWVFNRYLRGPLASLASAAEEISMENLDSFKVKMGLSGRNELTILEKSFNAMIGNLSKSKIEREQAEVKLAAEKERLAVTLRSIGDGVITADTSGKIVLINKIAEQLTGWHNEDAHGRPLEEVFHIINEQTREVCENPVKKVLSTGQIIGLANHTALIAKDGIERSIADSGAPILNEQSEIIGVVLVFRDVSEQIRTEQELLKVKKLESVGILAGGIAHDFNNILAAILGNINLALFDDSLKDSTKTLLSEAEKASLRAKDLTQQLLTFSKGGEPVKETSSLEDVIKESASFVLSGDKVACKYDFPSDLWLVDIDKGQISQVIQNIVLNASHAMPDGGVIKISCKNTSSVDKHTLYKKRKGKFVKIYVQDTGIGIPKKLIEKIFDPYYTTKSEGSGLGLAITQSIIHKHKGEIFVASSLGDGSAFTIYLPASEKIKPHGQTVIGESRESSQAKILIMDDEEMVRTVVKAMLVKIGHTITLAESGDEAIELYIGAKNSGNPFDLVIMDLTIPGGMGGKEAVKKILDVNPKAKVIVSSGYSNDPIIANFKDYGFYAAIVKPFQLQELSRVVSETLN